MGYPADATGTIIPGAAAPAADADRRHHAAA